MTRYHLCCTLHAPEIYEVQVWRLPPGQRFWVWVTTKLGRSPMEAAQRARRSVKWVFAADWAHRFAAARLQETLRRGGSRTWCNL